MLRTGALILALLMLAPAWSGQASDKAVLIELGRMAAAHPSSVSAGGAVVVGNLQLAAFTGCPRPARFLPAAWPRRTSAATAR